MKKHSADNIAKWRKELRNLKFEAGLLNGIIETSPTSFTLRTGFNQDQLMVIDKEITGKVLLSLQTLLAASIKAYEEQIEFSIAKAHPRDKNGYDKNNMHPDFD